MRKRLSLLAFVLHFLTGENIFAQSTSMSIHLLDAICFTVNEPVFVADANKRNRKDNRILAIASDYISVVSSRGYVVKAISGQRRGSGLGIEGLVKVSSLIGTTNRGNTDGLILMKDVVLPPADGSPVIIISATHSSWNGKYSTNKFNIAYKIGNKFAYIDKNARPSIIPVIFSVIQP